MIAAPATPRSHFAVIRDFEADLWGMDLVGFSAFVGELIERDAFAAERVTDLLDAVYTRVIKALSPAGYFLAADLGDGFIAVRSRVPGRDNQPELGNLLAGLPVRSAAVTGQVSVVRTGGWNDRWYDVLTGPAVHQYHDLQRSAVVGTGSLTPAATPQVTNKLALCEQRDRTYCFIAIPLHFGEDLAIHSEAVALGQAVVDAESGRFENVTHDDKGLLLRASFASGPGGIKSARRSAAEICDFARKLGLRAGSGIASGSVFEGVIGDPPRRTVHGVAVNRAAKLAARYSGVVVEPDDGHDVSVLSTRRSDFAPRLIGRQLELAQLENWFASAANGVSCTISGAPGIGKSHFLRHLVSLRVEQECVVQLSCLPQHMLDPFWLIREVLGSVRAEYAKAEDTGSQPTVGVEHSSVASAHSDGDARLAALAENLFEQLLNAVVQPVLCVIDDVQWIDRYSRAVLDRAVLEVSNFRLIESKRSAREGATRTIPNFEIDLGPLSPAALAEMAKVAGLSPHVAESVSLMSEGNPLFFQQLVWALDENTSVQLVSLDDILDVRLDSLSHDDRLVLRMIASCGRPVSPSVLAEIGTRLGFGLVTPSLERLESRRLIDVGRSGVAVVHRLIGERTAARIPQGGRYPLHLAIARTFQRCIPSRLARGELASHWRRAGRSGRAAVLYLREGQALVEEGAHHVAAELLDRAAELFGELEHRSSRTASLLASRAIAQWGAGEVRRAAIDQQSARDELAFCYRLRWGSLGLARLRLGSAVALSRGAWLGARDRLSLLRANVVRSEIGLFTGRIRDIALGTATTLMLRGAGPLQDKARARGLSFAAYVAWLARLPGLADRLYRLGFAGVGADLRPAANLWASQAVNHVSFGEWAKAEACLAEAHKILIVVSEPQLLDAVVTIDGLMGHYRGEYARAQALFAELLEAARRRGNRLHEAWGLYGQAMPLVRLNRWHEAEILTSQAADLLADTIEQQSVLICGAVRALSLVGQKRFDEAFVAASSAVSLARKLPPTNFGSLEGFGAAAEAMLLLATSTDNDRSIRFAARRQIPTAFAALRRYARLFPVGRPCHQRLLALEALDLGDKAAAVRRIRNAALQATALGMNGELLRSRMVGESINEHG